jgi:hypothetical protein
MVATGPFLTQLDQETAGIRLFRGREGDRTYVVCVFEDAGERLAVGFRKLGMAHLKGLEKLSVYELVDAVAIPPEELKEIPSEPLLAAVDRESTSILESIESWPSHG